MHFIQIQNITKQFSNHLALDNVSFEIEKGKIFGLLGPNGAGKTTLIRILTRITIPDKGEILFNGKLLSEKDLENIGYLPEERGLYKKMEVGEQALYLAQLKGIPHQEALKRLKYWFRKFEIEGWWKRKVDELSKGMQQKLQFITTIIHEPELLILDEPFSGFDPINTNLLKEEILQLKAKGTTVILSTHNMASVEEICDDIVLINKSKKILEGNIFDVKNRFKKNRFIIEIEKNDFNYEMERISQFTLISQKENPYSYVFEIQLLPHHSANELLTFFMNTGNIISFQEQLPSMNDIFIEQVNNSNG
ncbi:MAG: ABC transporter ATP-binding protein, partial [Bacteroidetes bacterium]|nr:ABC transporter ATP-binding protein [Bacteroidota bacterium]MCL1969241.1 ABC transporter ATP-binding protein [Bacteroidota bacterium]